MTTTSVIRRRYWKLIAGLVFACCSSVGATTSFAAESAMTPPHEVVSLGDLNLGNSRGVVTAYGRLLWAAERVCTGADSADYWVRESATPCVIQALSRAIDRIGAPKLRSYALTQPLFRLRRADTAVPAN